MNFYNISKYRSELMGLATILIIICHSPAHVQMPAMLEKFLRWCGIGVDIFLFLSGVGMYFSLKKSNFALGKWYVHRYLRILVPFLVFSVPYYLFRWTIDSENIWIFLSNISTFSYWTKHEGAWFVAMLIPLYLITPLLARVIDCHNNRFVPTIIICLLLVIIACLPADNIVMNNILHCIRHIPSYILGYWIGKMVFQKQVIDKQMLAMCWGGVLLYSILILTSISKNWLLMIPVTVFFSYIINRRSEFVSNNVLSFMGTISLESYLMNIYLPVVLRKIGYKDFLSYYDEGNYLFYLTVIVLGILLAFLGHLFSQYVIQRIDSTSTTQ